MNHPHPSKKVDAERQGKRLFFGMRSLYAGVVACALVFTGVYVVALARQNALEPHFGRRLLVKLEEPEPVVMEDFHRKGGQPPGLRIAIAPVISPEKSIEIYRDLAHYLAGRLGRREIILQRATYAEVNEMVRFRNCDVALVCTYPFVRGEQDFGMEALVVPRVKGAVSYRSLVIVPSASEAQSLVDLKGKRFACAEMMSTSGWLYPALWLKSHGEEPESFFSEIVVAGSHDRSVQAVLAGYVDGAAVHSLVYDRMVEEDPTVPIRTRIIGRSPPYGMPPFVVHPQLDPELKSKMRNILLHMHEDPEGKRILSALSFDRFLIPESASYDSVRRAVRRWEGRR